MKTLFILSVLLVASPIGNAFIDFFNKCDGLFPPPLSGCLPTTASLPTLLRLLTNETILALLSKTQEQLLAIGKRDVLTPLLQKVEIVVSEIEKLGGELYNVFGWLVNGLEGILKRSTTLDISPDAIVSEIDKLVGTHNLMADAFLKVIVQKVESTVASLMGHKRNAFTEFFKNLGAQIAATAKPYIDGVKNLAVTTGQAIKNAGLNLVGTAKQTIHTLGTKLQPHIDNLKAQTGQ